MSVVRICRPGLFLCALTLLGSSGLAQSGVITTVAGNGIVGFTGDGGPATSAELNFPYGVAVDSAGNIFIADQSNQRIRKVTPAGVISTVAGNGTMGFSGDGGAATSAELNNPWGLAVDTAGNLYIADQSNQRIRKVTPAGVISTVAGNGTLGFSGDGGAATSAELNNPRGVAVDTSGDIYIADYVNQRIRMVTPAGAISTIAGSNFGGFNGDGGPATSAELLSPTSVAVDGAGDIFITDFGNQRIRKVTPAGVISTIAGNGTSGFSGDGGPATSAEIFFPVGIAVDGSGNVFFGDNERIRKVTAAGVISTIVGNGTGGFSGDGGAATSAELNSPWATALDGVGDIYIADTSNLRIRKVTGASVAPLAITTTSPLQAAVLGAVYSQTLIASGGTPPYTSWAVTVGNLPTGLSLNSSTGTISGKDTAPLGTVYPFTIQVTDSAGATASAAFQISVSPPPSLAITTTSPLPGGAVGVAYTQTLAVTGGVPPYSGWTVTSGSLPPGLSLNSTTGVLSGIATGVGGTFAFNISVQDSTGATNSVAFQLTIQPPAGPPILSTLNFPKFFSAAELPNSGFAIVNPGTATASVTFTLYAATGTVVSTATLSFAPGTQAARTGDQIFSVLGSGGWVQVTSATAGLQGFWLAYNSALTYTDGAEAVATAVDETVPLVAGSTDINIANPNSTATTVSIQLVGSTGNQLANAMTETIPAYGVFHSDAFTLFNLPVQTQTCYVRVLSSGASSANALAVTAVVQNYLVPLEDGVVNGVDESSTATQLNFSHIVSGPLGSSNYTTVFGVTNLSNAAQTVAVTFFSANGSSSTPVQIQLAARGTLSEAVQSLFSLPPSVFQNGWIQATGSSPITGFAAYAELVGGAFTVVPAKSSASTNLMFAHIANLPPWQTGIALLNPGTTAANISIYAMTPSGTLIGGAMTDPTTAVLTLAPGNKTSLSLDQMIPEAGVLSATHPTDGGFVFIQSTNNVPIYGIELFYNANLTILSNVAAGTLASGISFTPPAPVAVPVGVQSLSLSSNSVASGGTVTGSVFLTAAAPLGGAVISLSSSSNAVSVPYTVSVPAGTASTTFTVSTGTVISNQTVTITVSYNGTSVQASLTVTPTMVTQVQISITPAPPTIEIGGTQQFVALVTGTANPTVNWSVNGIVGGNVTAGTISTSGLYTAPLGIPNPNTVTIRVTSLSDPAMFAMATLAIAVPEEALTLSSISGNPGDILSLTGPFDTNASIQVAFTTASGYQILVPAISVTSVSASVIIPYFVDLSTGQVSPTTVSISVVEQAGTASTVFTPTSSFNVGALPILSGSPGAVTLAFLTQSQTLMTTAQQDQVNLQSSSGVDTSALQSDLAAIQTQFSIAQTQIQSLVSGKVSQINLGTLSGNPVFLDTSSLVVLDQLLTAYTTGNAAQPTAASRLLTAKLGLLPPGAFGIFAQLSCTLKPSVVFGAAKNANTFLSLAMSAAVASSFYAAGPAAAGALAANLGEVAAATWLTSLASALTVSALAEVTCSALNGMADENFSGTLLDEVCGFSADVPFSYLLNLGGAMVGFPVMTQVLDAARGAMELDINCAALSKVYQIMQVPPPPSTPLYELTLTNSGTGSGTVNYSPPGIPCPSPYDCYFIAANTVVTFTANPATGSTFAGWSGCSGTNTTCTLTINSDVTVTAVFSLLPQYTLMVASAGSGGGTINPPSPLGTPCGTNCWSYPAGTVVTLTANPATGSTFAGWSGCSGTGTICTVTMSSNLSVTPTFNPTASSGAACTPQQQSAWNDMCLTQFNINSVCNTGTVLQQLACSNAALVVWGQCLASCTPPNYMGELFKADGGFCPFVMAP